MTPRRWLVVLVIIVAVLGGFIIAKVVTASDNGWSTVSGVNVNPADQVNLESNAPSNCVDGKIGSHCFVLSDGGRLSDVQSKPEDVRLVSKGFRVPEAFTAIDCITPEYCVILDSQGVQVWLDRPRLETKTFSDTIRKGGDVTSLSCVTTQYCVAGSDGLTNLRLVGSRWSTQIAPSDRLGSRPNFVWCAKAGACIGVGGVSWWLYSDRGWSKPVTFVYSLTDISGMSCTPAGQCGVVDDLGHFYLLQYSGRGEPQIAYEKALPVHSGFQFVSCSGHLTCIAYAWLTGVFWKYADGKWSTFSVDSEVQRPFESFSCSQRGWCVVVALGHSVAVRQFTTQHR